MMNSSILAAWLRKLKPKDLWWGLEIAYPVVFVLLLFGFLTYLIYSGQRQMQLASKAEASLLVRSLVWASNLSNDSSNDLSNDSSTDPFKSLKYTGVGVVTIDPVDLAPGESSDARSTAIAPSQLSHAQWFGDSDESSQPEASITYYSRIIKKVSWAGAGTIVVSWDTKIHGLDPSDYVFLRKILDEISQVGTQVLFAAPANDVEALKFLLGPDIVIAADFQCNEPGQVNSFCPFDTRLSGWVIQNFIASLLSSNPENSIEPYLNVFMPSSATTFALRLRSEDDLFHISANTLLTEDAADQIPLLSKSNNHRSLALAPGGMVFIGIDARGVGTANLIDEEEEGRLVLVPGPRHDQSFGSTPTSLLAGKIGHTVPMHIFWALIADQVETKNFISMPGPTLAVLMVVAFAFLIIIILRFFGITTALGMFICYCLGAPLLNSLLIAFQNFYLPVFNGVYFGFATFALVGFGKLSLTAWQRWRLQADREMTAKTANLKGNFISLMSHNLNTPIAKMQGMLQILSSAPGPGDWKTDIKAAEACVTELEFAIKSLLISAAIEDGESRQQKIKLTSLADNFENQYGPSFKKLGLTVRGRKPAAFEDDYLNLPLAIDTRAILGAVAAAIALFSTTDQAQSLGSSLVLSKEADLDSGLRRQTGELNYQFALLEEHEARAGNHLYSLVFAIESSQAILSTPIVQMLLNPRMESVRRLHNTNLLGDILAGLVSLVVNFHNGQVRIRPLPQGCKLTLSFQVS